MGQAAGANFVLQMDKLIGTARLVITRGTGASHNRPFSGTLGVGMARRRRPVIVREIAVGCPPGFKPSYCGVQNVTLRASLANCDQAEDCVDRSSTDLRHADERGFMFDISVIICEACLRLRSGLTSAVVTVLAAAALLLGAPSPATGAVVYNRTDMTMRIADLGEPKDSVHKCRVLMKPWARRPETRSCSWRQLPPGKSSRSIKISDADAFRFDWDGQAFTYTIPLWPPPKHFTRRIGGRTYLKIRDPQVVVCSRIKGFPPSCVG